MKSTGDMQTFVVQAKERWTEILRPAFYKTLGSRTWEPPSKMAALTAAKIDVNELAQKQTKLDAEKKKLEEKKAELAKLPAPPSKEAPAPREPAQPTRPGDRPNQPTPPQTPKETKEAPNITSQRNRLNTEIKAIEKEIATLEADVTKLSAVQGGDTASATGASLLASDEVRFWVHDCTAQPGEKYRYRLRVGVNNPLFGRGALLKDEQKPAAEASIVRGPWSEWSSQVEVDRSEYFFVTSVTPRSELGEARASVELFKFYLGYYRKQTAGMNIGDPLVRALPLTHALAATLAVNPQQPAAPAVPAAQPPTGRENPPQQPVTPPEAAAPAIDFVIPDRIRVATSVLLLDVAQVPGNAGAAVFAAILRDANGSIVIKTAENERDSALYKRLELSFKAGEAAAVAKPQ